MTLVILLPKPNSSASRVIDAGSGIVADPDNPHDPTGLLVVYYEGNRYGSENMKRYTERCLHAAGRLSARYPTIAMGAFPAVDFVKVGEFSFDEDWNHWEMAIDPDQLDAVVEWTNHEPGPYNASRTR